MKKIAFLLTLLCGLTAPANEVTFQLAQELLSEENLTQAATEFRRFAMESDDPAQQASAYLYAGYSYLKDDQPQPALEMIDRAEAADAAGALTLDRTLLSAVAAQRAQDLESALYYYELLTEETERPDMRPFALRHAAAIELMQGNPTAAQLRLRNQPDELSALNRYLSEKDKSPTAGALWGLIPGAGYFYSGEYANGFRSLLLNSLFMFGMAHTADQDQWGAFSAISFFELTWYSGSIYGGVDAAQRYNQARLEHALHDMGGQASLRPDNTAIPLFKLKLQF